jgi:hypothetical protein
MQEEPGTAESAPIIVQITYTTPFESLPSPKKGLGMEILSSQ